LRLASRLFDAGANGADRSWLTHATARAIRDAEIYSERLDFDDAATDHWRQLDPGEVLVRLHRVGATAAFRWEVTKLQGADGGIIATVRSTQDREQAVTWAPVFDAVLAVAELVFPGDATLQMPTQLKELVVSGIPPTTAVVDVRLHDDKHTPDTVDIMVAAETGEVVARMTDLRFGSIEGNPGANPSSGRLLHHVEWVCLPVVPAVTALRPVVVVGSQDPLTASLCTCLTASGVEYARISQPEELAGTRLIPGADVVVLPSGGDAYELDEAAADVAWRLARTAQVLAKIRSTEAGRLWAVNVALRPPT
jgi:6-methylsalicylic acid synthase